MLSQERKVSKGGKSTVKLLSTSCRTTRCGRKSLRKNSGWWHRGPVPPAASLRTDPGHQGRRRRKGEAERRRRPQPQSQTSDIDRGSYVSKQSYLSHRLFQASTILRHNTVEIQEDGQMATAFWDSSILCVYFYSEVHDLKKLSLREAFIVTPASKDFFFKEEVYVCVCVYKLSHRSM